MKRFVIIVATIIIAAYGLHGAPLVWTGTAANGLWADVNNWGGSAYPQVGDTATFNSGTTGTVVFLDAGAIACDAITVNDASAAITFNQSVTVGGPFSFTGSALTLNATLSATTITIANSGAFSTAAAGDITATAGGFSQTGAGTNSLAGDITTTGNIGFATGLTLSGPIALDSGGGTITIASITGGSQDLTIAAGTAAGTTTVTGNVTGLGDGTGAALTVANGVTGLVYFQGTFGGNSGIAAGNAGNSLRFDGNVTLADGTMATTITTTQLDGLTWSSYDGASFGALTLSTAAVSLNSNGGAISAASITGGSQDLTIAAGTAAGTTTVTGNVTSLGDGTGAALTVANGVTGLVYFQGTFGGNSGIAAGNAGNSLRFDGNVTLADGDTATTITTTRLDGLTWSSYDGASFGALTLSTAAVSLNSNGGAISAASITGGSQDLTIAAGTAAGTTTVTVT